MATVCWHFNRLKKSDSSENIGRQAHLAFTLPRDAEIRIDGAVNRLMLLPNRINAQGPVAVK